MADALSARHNSSLGVVLPTPSCSVNPLRASSGFLCIDSSEICVHLLNPQHQPYTVVNTELDWVQLFIRYICLVTSLILYKLLRAAEYCRVVCCVMHIVELCPEVFDHSGRIHAITADLGLDEYRHRI
jgi:hypothetical protein